MTGLNSRPWPHKLRGFLRTQRLSAQQAASLQASLLPLNEEKFSALTGSDLAAKLGNLAPAVRANLLDWQQSLAARHAGFVPPTVHGVWCMCCLPPPASVTLRTMLSPPADSWTAEFLRAQGGDVHACFNLAVWCLCYTAQPVEGALWLRTAAASGHRQARMGLALCYLHGQGVGRANPVTGFLYLQLLSEGQQDAWSQLQLAKCYRNGWGVPRQPAKYRHWLRLSALGGEPAAVYNWACNRLAAACHESAFVWFSRAARAGVPDALRALAYCYMTGRGTARDPVQARFCLQQYKRFAPLSASLNPPAPAASRSATHW